MNRRIRKKLNKKAINFLSQHYPEFDFDYEDMLMYIVCNGAKPLSIMNMNHITIC